jgi:hypothetical protein
MLIQEILIPIQSWGKAQLLDHLALEILTQSSKENKYKKII